MHLRIALWRLVGHFSKPEFDCIFPVSHRGLQVRLVCSWHSSVFLTCPGNLSASDPQGITVLHAGRDCKPGWATDRCRNAVEFSDQFPFP